MVRREKHDYRIQAVVHALDVLEQFAGDAELGVTELSTRLGLYKNNVFRVLATLESRGYVEQSRATERYRLGVKCLQLGRSYIQHTSLAQHARLVLREVVDTCAETAYVAVRHQRTVVPVDVIEPEQAVRIVPPIGRSLPLYRTAAGKVHLAFENRSDGRIRIPEGPDADAERTAADRERLAVELDRIAHDGYALDTGEEIADVCTVAVPVRDHTRAVVGSLAISGPAYRMDEERLRRELVPLAVRAGHDLSGRLGSPPPEPRPRGARESRKVPSPSARGAG